MEKGIKEIQIKTLNAEESTSQKTTTNIGIVTIVFTVLFGIEILLVVGGMFFAFLFCDSPSATVKDCVIAGAMLPFALTDNIIERGVALLIPVIWLIFLILYITRKIKSTREKNFLLSKQTHNVTSSSIITPLLGAIISGDMDLVRTALQDHPEHLNTAYAQNGNTPLHVAALNGKTEIVKLLLAQPGIDKTLKNNEGKTAADLAQEKGFAEIVESLN